MHISGAFVQKVLNYLLEMVKKECKIASLPQHLHKMLLKYIVFILERPL